MVLAVFIVGLSQYFLVSGFQAIENDLALRSSQRLVALLKEELQANLSIADQYAVWDDTYQFVKKPDSKYIETNYEADLGFDMGVNLLLITNQKNNVLYCIQYNLSEKAKAACAPTNLEFIKQSLAKFGAPKIDQKLSQHVRIADGEFGNLVITPILKSDATGPAIGHLVVMRFLNPLVPEEISKIVAHPIRLSVSEAQNHESKIDQGLEFLTATSWVPLWSQPEFLQLDVEYPRDISGQGKKTISFFIALAGAGIISIMLIIFGVFSRYVVGPVSSIKNNLKAIGLKADHAGRLPSQRDDEIGDLVKEINSTLGRLEEAQIAVARASKFSALGELAGHIAHEINNPLAIIIGFSNKITRDAQSLSPEALKELASRINYTCARMERIVRSLRLVSRDGDKDPKELVTVGKLFEEVMILSEAKLQSDQVRVITDKLNRDLVTSARSIQIVQVFLNLMTNSLDAIEGLSDRWIEFRSFSRPGELVIQVIDSGKGIPDEVLARMMEPFYSTKEVGKGTGLGLSISKKIIEDHGGKILFSLVDGHTCFEIHLPASAQ